MAIEEFWLNIRTAVRLGSTRAVVDSPSLDAGMIERILRDINLWLTKRAVEGYDSSEFDFLSEDERLRLTESIERFRAVAEHVPGNGPATPQQEKDASRAFREILAIVRPDKYDSVEAFKIGKKIERMVADKRPGWVHDLVFETDLDASGDPALWIWVVADDEAVKRKDFRDQLATVEERLREATSRESPERWPYIRLRTVSERRDHSDDKAARPRTRKVKK